MGMAELVGGDGAGSGQCLMEQLGCRDAFGASGVSWLLLEPWNSAAVLCSSLGQMC